MKRNILIATLALAAIYGFSTPASAQHGRGGHVAHVGHAGGYYGGYRGYHGGYYGGYRGGYYGGYPGYRHGGYGYGYGLGLSSGIILGNALRGYGYGGYAPSYVPSYSSYGAYDYLPSMTYIAPSTTYVLPSTTYVDPNAPTVAATPADSSRDSLYYAPESADNTARLRILLPADAKVWVDGMETNKIGSEREFGSPPLTPGKAYYYEVKARWMQAGEPVEQTRRVKVEANRTTTVDFGKVAERDK